MGSSHHLAGELDMMVIENMMDDIRFFHPVGDKASVSGIFKGWIFLWIGLVITMRSATRTEHLWA